MKIRFLPGKWKKLNAEIVIKCHRGHSWEGEKKGTLDSGKKKKKLEKATPPKKKTITFREKSKMNKGF
jgi:hypothetical protein